MSRSPSVTPSPCVAALRGHRMPVCTLCPLHPDPERPSSNEAVCWGIDPWGFKPPRVQGHQEPQRTAKAHPKLHNGSQQFAQKPVTRGQGQSLVSYNRVSPLNPQRKQAASQSPGPEAVRESATGDKVRLGCVQTLGCGRSMWGLPAHEAPHPTASTWPLLTKNVRDVTTAHAGHSACGG